MEEKIWTLYLCRCSDNSLYCGISHCVDRRISEHNGEKNSKKGAKYTSKRRPVKLVYKEKLTASKSEAMKREYKVKHLKKKDKEALILSESNELKG